MDGKAAEKRTESLECPKHGKYTGEVLNLFGTRGTEVSSMCPICQQEIDAEQIRQEEQARKNRRIAHFKSMNIDERFWETSFDNFDAYNNELRGHLATCLEFAKQPDGKLVMLGEHGNGKTHLAISVLKELGGRIYTAYEIGLMLRQSYGGGTNEWEVFYELCTVPLLVIDEVEKIKDSESKQQWVSHVVGKRYNRMLPIIFIANCHTQKDCKEPDKPCPKCLESHLENDVLSRIIEDGIVMKFESPDYREKKRLIRLGRE
jgi:DNA replication protein DnaC